MCLRKFVVMHIERLLNMDDLYKRIAALCAQNGITITGMCKESGSNRASLTDLKKGRKQGLSTETLAKIATYFKVSVDFLLGVETKKAPTDGERTVSDDDIKFTLFGGDGEITDAMKLQIADEIADENPPPFLRAGALFSNRRRHGRQFLPSDKTLGTLDTAAHVGHVALVDGLGDIGHRPLAGRKSRPAGHPIIHHCVKLILCQSILLSQPSGNFLGYISVSVQQILPRASLVGKPSVDGQYHFVRPRLIRQGFELLLQPQQPLFPVSPADIRTEVKQCIVGSLRHLIRGGGLTGHLNGNCPMVVVLAGGAPGSVTLRHAQPNAAVIAHHIVAGRALFGVVVDKAGAVTAPLRRHLPHIAVDGDAADVTVTRAGAVWADFCVGDQRAVAHTSSSPASPSWFSSASSASHLATLAAKASRSREA